MDGRLRDGEVVVGGDARQRFHDSRAYGRPLDDGRLALAPVEAAHLLFRGDLDAVNGEQFQSFVAGRNAGFVPRFLVYKDLRDRGFYLSPAGRAASAPAAGTDFEVYPRGKGPWDGEVAYRVRAIGERVAAAADALGAVTLAVVDEESEITYLETGAFDPPAGDPFDPPPAQGTLLGDRVVVWDPPAALHGQGFYGQPLADREDAGPAAAALHLSLVEGAYLAAGGALALDVESAVERGRAVEGERFDRRLRAYRRLRDAGLVPKTGFKFGADFRVYDASSGELGHADFLVRVLPPGHDFAPRDLALDVRLAAGVRKQLVFARDGAEGDWLTVGRLTP
jgi:tRNA-intron endonuclease